MKKEKGKEEAGKENGKQIYQRSCNKIQIIESAESRLSSKRLRQEMMTNKRDRPTMAGT